jgi:hypothetical protein
MEYEVDFMPVGDQPVYSLVVDGHSFDAHVYPYEETWQVLFHGELFTVSVEDEREKRLRASLAGKVADHVDYHLKAPMRHGGFPSVQSGDSWDDVLVC